MTPPAILIIIPTTAGPLRLRALTPRSGLPASAAFADGDYRPLPWSADYARLCAAGGPLARLVGHEVGPHELRLSGSFDAGRSWEVPVGLAHGLTARGHRLVAEPAEADLILWATGAVDLDLAVLPGDYALLDKIERSRSLLAEAPRARLAVLLPDGPERAAAETAVRALGRPEMLPGKGLTAALDALTRPADPPVAAEAPPPARRLRRLALPVGALAAAGVAAMVAFTPRSVPSLSTKEPAATFAATTAAEPPAREPGTAAATAAKPPDADPAPAPKAPAAPMIHVEELRAPAGSSCRRVAFGADAPERRPVPVETADRFAPTRLAPDLCGIAVRAEAPASRIEVGPELRAAALPPVRLADGAQGYFLREGGRQNLVYAVQAVTEAGAASGPRLVHALTR
ncbi:hypothetical protein HNR00_004510 [Methylorubrum rhodinum]|uniref:Uncharacterized protein n=1 Tax=Methylorubrum rhodinum TaxID=29428 RepID=A0A840ZQA4_9HYPH|nr:hypothetical protein [Methylorubrum rhodinum]MBB5759776.1 hypothetical protein [Methylorubrum rhodinum]